MQQKHGQSQDANSQSYAIGSKAPLQCSICGKIFVYPSQLAKHMAAHEQVRQKRKSVETPVRNGPHVCPICNQGFWHTRNLGNHMFVHREHAMLYDCSRCGRSFNHRRYLTIHEATHRDTPLTCSLCPKSFRSQTRLTIHVKKSHGAQTAANGYSQSAELQQQQQLVEPTAQLYESVFETFCEPGC
jgi:KRAB domain-containing zinc finger protein